MRIDATHRPWIASTLIFLAAAAAIYIPYAYSAEGTRGGSALGLVFGISGYALMIYAALFGVRRRFPTWRVGRVATWMRGHLWLGFLSFPLLLFHSGFAAKGGLTSWLMILLIVVIVMGVAGAVIQHYLPSMMTRAVPLETIYEEIPKIREQLRQEADELMAKLAIGQRDESPRFVWGARAPGALQLDVIDIAPEAMEHFRRIYDETIHPFLCDPDHVSNECAYNTQAPLFFGSLRTYLPKEVHDIITDLESICEEERQLKRQRLIYRCLHGWLLLHVPLALALILLGGIHAIMALGY